MAVQLGEILQGLGMLGGVLSLPRQVQHQQQESEMMRQALAGTVDEATLNAVAPQPSLRWLSAGGTGVGSKILGGIGDVGSVLSAIAGKPISPPRASMTDLAAISKMRTDKAKRDAELKLQERMAAGAPVEEIAGLGVAAGSSDAAIRAYSRRGEKPPWRGDPADRVRLTKEEERAQRAEAAERMIWRNETDKQNFIHGGISPQQQPMRQSPAEIAADEEARQGVRRAAELREREAFIKAQRDRGTPLTPDQETYYRANGSLPAPTQEPKARPTTYDSIYQRTYQNHLSQAQQANRDPTRNPELPPATVDAAAVQRDVMAQVEAIEAAGGTVVGRPPKQAPPQAPPPVQEPEMSIEPPPGAAGSQQGAGVPTGGTAGGSAAPTPQTPGSFTNFTAPSQLTPEQAAYVEQLNGQINAGVLTREQASEKFVLKYGAAKKP